MSTEKSEEMDTGESSRKRLRTTATEPASDQDIDLDSFLRKSAEAVIQPKAPHPSPFSSDDKTVGNYMQSVDTEFARRIELDEFKDFIYIVYDYIKNILCHGFDLDATIPIDDDEFFTAMQYFQQMRLYQVARPFSTSTLPGNIPYSRDLLLPKAVADCFNQLGVCYMNTNATRFTPFPAKEQATDSVSVKFGLIRSKYNKFLLRLTTQGIVPLESISGSPTGTCFWILNPISVFDRATVPLDQKKELVVASPFGGISPAYAKDAAIYLRQPYVEEFYELWYLPNEPDDKTKFKFRMLAYTQRYLDILEEREQRIERFK